MGRLLEALKKKNIDLNKADSFQTRYTQKQAKAIVTECLKKLPEEERFRIMDKYISPQKKDERVCDAFTAKIRQIRETNDDAVMRKFLTNDKNFGRPWQELLPEVEKVCTPKFVQDEYEKLPPDASKEDKLLALFKCSTYRNRMSKMWDCVNKDLKAEYSKKLLPASVKNPELFARFLDEPGSLAEGQDWIKLAEEIEGSMDEASIDEAAKKVGEINGPSREYFRQQLDGSISRYDSDKDIKKRSLRQLEMLLPEAALDPDDLKAKFRSEKWYKTVNPTKEADRLMKKGELDISALVEKSKQIIADAPSEEESRICKEAALRNYRGLKLAIPMEEQNSEAALAFKKHAAELQEGLTRESYSQFSKVVDDALKLMDQQIEVLEEKKSGWFLSSTNSPEHDRMTKSLRLFKAKLNMINGKEVSGLSPEELETVKNGDVKELYEDAKSSTYKYSCLKTDYGKGSIWHEAGEKRNDASRNTYDLLRQLGSRLHLSDPATRVREDAAFDVLRFRKYDVWEETNAEKYAAQTIYALSLTHSGVPEEQQRELLSEKNLEDAVEQMRQRPAFKQMVKDLGPTGLCETICKGSDALTLAYSNAAEKVAAPNAKVNNKQATMTATQEHEFWNKKGDPTEAPKETQGPAAGI